MSSYKILCFLADVEWSGVDWRCGSSCLVLPTVYDQVHRNAIVFAEAEGVTPCLGFSINFSNSFRVDSIHLTRLFTAARIYKVVGIY